MRPPLSKRLNWDIFSKWQSWDLELCQILESEVLMWLKYLIQIIQKGFHHELWHNAGLYQYFCFAKNIKHLRPFSFFWLDTWVYWISNNKNLNLYQNSKLHIFAHWGFIILSDLASNFFFLFFFSFLFFTSWKLLFAINQNLDQNCFNIHLYPHTQLPPLRLFNILLVESLKFYPQENNLYILNELIQMELSICHKLINFLLSSWWFFFKWLFFWWTIYGGTINNNSISLLFNTVSFAIFC